MQWASVYESTLPPPHTVYLTSRVRPIDYHRLFAEVEATVFPLLDAGWTPAQVREKYYSRVLDDVIRRRRHSS